MSVTVPIVVRGELIIKIEDLPDMGLELIKSDLSFENEDKLTQQREQVHGFWNLPDTIDLWRAEERLSGDHVLVLPRGFALRLGQILAKLDAQAVFDDQRVAPEAEPGYFQPFLLRDYQIEAVMAMLRAQQGFVQAPAGAGKTVIALGCTTFAPTPTLVIMDKADIVDQWREQAERWLGLSTDFDHPRSTGKIGMGVWEERDLTIALRQTLHERIDELDGSQWWKKWGRTIYDEGQHLAADTLAEISRRCISRDMFGTSATPARTPMKGKIVEALVGPVIHRVPRKLLRDRGILIKPVVRVKKTDFQADFWSTHESEGDGDCQKPGCTKSRQHMHRNNYTSILKALTEDKQRNKMIAEEIVGQRGHVHLVPSRQLKHLDHLKKAIEKAGWDGPIYYLRGEENARGESRGIVAEVHEQHEVVILSTVADEALDVPPIDNVHLVFPMRQGAATEQLIGRGERSYEGKDGAVVTDYCDELCEPLFAQYMERLETYRRLELEFEQVPDDEPVKFDSGTFSSFCADWPIQVAHPLNGAEIYVTTREQLFQAMKTKDEDQFMHVLTSPTAAEAKKRGQRVDLREDWEEVKYGVMRSIIRDQVEQHPKLAAELRATGSRPIVEDRPDPEWGVGPDGNGKNLLGKAWVEVRDSMKESS